MNDLILEKAIRERIEANEKHARGLKSQSRHSFRRLNRELNWVLDLMRE